jgi:hypothetical protein
VVDAQNLNVVGAGRAHHGADDGVHARRVTAGGQNRDPVDIFLIHAKFLHFTMFRLLAVIHIESITL